MHRYRTTRRHGFSLVETAIALGVVGVALGGMAIMQGDSQMQTKDAATASLLQQWQGASLAYYNANSQAIATAIAAAGGPVAVGMVAGESSDQGLPNLQNNGYVAAGVTNQTAYGAKLHLVFGQDVNGNVDGFVFSNAAQGAPIPDLDLGRITMKVGATGGAVYNSPPKGAAGYVLGSGGGWSLPLATFTPVGGAKVGPTTDSIGTMVGFFGASGNLTAYLYRNNIGVPAANTMNTDINMSGVGIDKAANVDTQALNNTQGGSIAVGSSGTPTGLVVNGGATGVHHPVLLQPRLHADRRRRWHRRALRVQVGRRQRQLRGRWRHHPVGNDAAHRRRDDAGRHHHGEQRRPDRQRFCWRDP
jgi:Tfp pilus assembly protein PilV